MKDRFNREIDYLRLSITDNCNLRCIYCMKENTSNFFSEDERLTDSEIIKIINLLAKLGIRKVRLTGGEPLLRKKIIELISEINRIEGIEEIFITTNAILLENKIEELVKVGLKGVNISLDSLKADRFKSITRYGDIQNVLSSINKAIDIGLTVKINTVLLKGINDDEVLDFVNLTINNNLDVRFIELMPMGIGKAYDGISNNEVLETIKKNNNITEIISSKNSGPANYIKINGAIGKIGFISAITKCFCKDCNRIRITADGFLKQCLNLDFGTDLKKYLRNNTTEDELLNLIKKNIYDKPEKNLFYEKDKHEEIKLMNQIGG